MLGTRLELQDELCDVLGSSNVYFQPPENLKIKYPCICYVKGNGSILHADDDRYRRINSYELTVIDTDPDSTIADDLLDHFKYCSTDRYFVAENLNHTTLTLYY